MTYVLLKTVKMLKLLLLVTVLLLQGCAGTGAGIANHYNTVDPCQSWGKPQGYKIPDLCYTSTSRTVWITRQGQTQRITIR
jgi:hypothetical protein